MKEHLLLLHGALGTKHQLNSLKKQLINHFEVHDMDFEGHGENRSSKEFSIDLFSNNVIDFLKEKEIENTHIFGYSMGGYVALNVASKYPKLVDKIITLGTKFDWTEESAEAEVKMLNPDKIETKVPAFAQHLASIHTQNSWKDVMRKTADMMLGLGAGQKLTDLELRTIDQKICVGIGSEDRMVTILESKENADILPNGKLKIIQGFQHPIEKVDTDLLQSIICNFMKE